MRKTLLTLGMSVLLIQAVDAQIFSEDFESVPLTSGTGNLPAGWAQYNVDGLTPASNMSFMGSDAWKVRSVNGTKAAVSTSWYSSAGTSNDWMVTPSITIPASGNIFLKFKEYAPDPSFSDGYQVYISTTGNTVADFTGSPVLSVNAANSNDFTTKLVDLSAYYGQTIYIAFRNNSFDKFLLYIDDVEVVDLPNYDAKVETVSIPRYGVINTNSNLVIRVANMGAQTITSLTIDWNDGTAHSATITGLNITAGNAANVTHTTPVNYSTIEEKVINVTIDQVNGNADANPADNTGTAKFNSTSSAPARAVVIEEGTGTWCGWCPRGAVAMEYMYNNYASQGFIGIAVHNQDPMMITEYDNGANFSGFPSCNADRFYLDASVSQANFIALFNARKAIPSPVEITCDASVSGDVLTVPVEAKFVTKFANGSFRLAAIVVENGVTGTGSGYDQVNYYANNANGPMGGYENLPSTIPASQMVYDHVGRALLGGYNGQANSVPAAINDGTTATHTFTWTIPATTNKNKLKVVAIVIDNSTGEIVNAVEVVPSGITSNEEAEANFQFNVFPNPTTDVLNVSFDLNDATVLNVMDINGRIVMSKNINGVENMVNVPVSNLASGTYFISISNKDVTHTKTFIKK